MRGLGIVSIFTILVSMGLLMIIMAQNQVRTMLEKECERLQERLKTLDERLSNEDVFKIAVEKLVVQGTKALEDLEDAVAKLGPEMKKKETENDACQAEKKTKSDELAGSEKEQADTEASLKSESDAWNQEIDTLKAQLTGHSPICDHLKTSTLAAKLCGTLSPALTSTN